MLRSSGKFSLIFFLFFFSPGCFLLVSLIVATTAAAICELEQLRAAEASRKEREFSQIVKALKRREEEEVKRRGSPPHQHPHWNANMHVRALTMHLRALHRRPARRQSRRVQTGRARTAESSNQAAKEVRTPPLRPAGLFRCNTGGV